MTDRFLIARSSALRFVLAFSAAWGASGCIIPARVEQVDENALAKAMDPETFGDALETEASGQTVLASAVVIVEAEEIVEPKPAEVEAGPTEIAADTQAPEEVPAEAQPEAKTGPIVSPAVSTAPKFKSIRDISLDIAPPKLVDDRGRPFPSPMDYAAEVFDHVPPFARDADIDYRYNSLIAPEGLEFCYQPLYFEEVNLERYGRSFGILQPVVSAGQFYSRIPLLPYHVFAQPARRCTYHPHWTLPGYRIPCREWHPISF